MIFTKKVNRLEYLARMVFDNREDEKKELMNFFSKLERSHVAAQRLAEAARYVDYSTPIIEDTWGDDEVFEIRLTAKGIRDLRAALAKWEAVK